MVQSRMYYENSDYEYNIQLYIDIYVCKQNRVKKFWDISETN